MIGASLGIRWLRLWASTAGGKGSIPGWGTKILDALLDPEGCLKCLREGGRDFERKGHPRALQADNGSAWGKGEWVDFIIGHQLLLEVSPDCLVVSDSLWPPRTVAHQTSLSMGFSRQEYCSGLACPPLGDLPNWGIKPATLMYLALACWFFTTSITWEAQSNYAPS